MKNINKLFIIAIALFLILTACKKDSKTTTVPPPTNSTDNYSSVKAFFAANGAAMQTYTVNAITGGSFISPQGTTVTIPPNAFITIANAPVTGNVTIQFKDIYKKSDMLLSNMPTQLLQGDPLKSGGEFYIKALSNNSAIKLASGKKIAVSQPASLTGGLDTINAMQPFIQTPFFLCPAQCPPTYAWDTSNTGIVSYYNTIGYVFNLYQFHAPVDSGTWANSDNATFFSAYQQTQLNIVANDSVNKYGTYVFLLFKNLTSMVHVYNYYEMFPYSYAPIGLQCTVVAVGVKNGTLYSAFVPITISANQTIHFTLSPTTTSAFTTQVKTLD